MKKAIQYVILFILLTSLGIILTNRESVRENVQKITGINIPCSKPVKYSVGEVDPRFGLTKEQVLGLSYQAEKVWEDPTGKNLFEYNSEAELKINLVFDERQVQSNRAENIETNLENLESAHEITSKEYESLISSYNQKIKSYENKADEYREKLAGYNKDVQYWNNNGGAPKEEYDKLEKEKNDLEELYASLEKIRKEINILASKTNKAAVKENEIVGKYNSNLETYNSEFGNSKEFEKGLFDGQAINIYEFKETADLKMTIIHEMGHTLGVGHLNDPKSIMYYLMGEQDLNTQELTNEDISAIKNICEIN